jgi:hypothetical protein
MLQETVLRKWKSKSTSKAQLLLSQVILFILNWNKLIEARSFLRQTLTQFWVAHLHQEAVSCLTEKAVDVLIQFGTTYLCKSEFSSTETVSMLTMTSVLHCQKLNPPLIRTVCMCVFSGLHLCDVINQFIPVQNKTYVF